MSAAYYVVLENPGGIDAAMDGKSLASNMITLTAFCQDLGVRPLEAFGRVAPEMAKQLMAEAGLADLPLLPEEWFPPEDGIAVVTVLLPYVQKNADFVSHPARLLEDLERLLAILRDAQRASTRWHLEVDM